MTFLFKQSNYPRLFLKRIAFYLIYLLAKTNGFLGVDPFGNAPYIHFLRQQAHEYFGLFHHCCLTHAI